MIDLIPSILLSDLEEEAIERGVEGDGYTDGNIEWDHTKDECFEFINFMFRDFDHLPSEDIILGDGPISIAEGRVKHIEHDYIHLHMLNFGVIGWEVEDDSSFCELAMKEVKADWIFI